MFKAVKLIGMVAAPKETTHPIESYPPRLYQLGQWVLLYRPDLKKHEDFPGQTLFWGQVEQISPEERNGQPDWLYTINTHQHYWTEERLGWVKHQRKLGGYDWHILCALSDRPDGPLL